MKDEGDGRCKLRRNRSPCHGFPSETAFHWTVTVTSVLLSVVTRLVRQDNQRCPKSFQNCPAELLEIAGSVRALVEVVRGRRFSS
jgi:hypothetical protein